jgi:hypothetical protein
VTYAAVLPGPVALFQPSGSLTPTAKGSGPSEPAVSSETANRRMSSGMSGPLSDKPDGTTPLAQGTNTYLPAGQLPNKMPISITGVIDTHAFLAWLRESCPCDLTTQLKGEKLMVVPSTPDGFRAAVSALRSIDGKEDVSFHAFRLPEDRCVRLLVKNLGRGRPASVVREELESLNIRVQGFMQLPSDRRYQDATKDRPPTPTSLYQWREVLSVESAISHRTLRLASVGGVVRGTKRPISMHVLPAFGHTQRNYGYVLRCSACGDFRLSGGCSTSREQPQCCSCGRNYTANSRGYNK